MSRLINADEALEKVHNQGTAHPSAYHLTNYATLILQEAPTIDAVEVIRCKNCKYHKDMSVPEYKHCCMIGQTVKYDAFCSYGKSITEDENNGSNSN